MGLKIAITDTVLTDTTLPVFRDDKLLNAGSLVLFDPTNPVSGLTAVPASGGSLVNIAWKQAKALLAIGDINSLSLPWTNTLTSSQGIVEMTAKRGLHGLISQVNHAANAHARFDVPQAVKTYMLANPTRSFYVGQIGFKTRLPLTQNYQEFQFVSTVSNQGYNNLLFFGERDATFPSSGAAKLGATVPSNVLGAYWRDVAVNAWAGTRPVDSTTFNGWRKWGASGFNGSTEVNKSQSDILYFFYLEDLTASGRTYAQANADVQARYNLLFNPTNGRLLGDSYTASSVLL